MIVMIKMNEEEVKEYKAIYDGTYQPIDEYFG